MILPYCIREVNEDSLDAGVDATRDLMEYLHQCRVEKECDHCWQLATHVGLRDNGEVEAFLCEGHLHLYADVRLLEYDDVRPDEEDEED